MAGYFKTTLKGILKQEEEEEEEEDYNEALPM